MSHSITLHFISGEQEELGEEERWGILSERREGKWQRVEKRKKEREVERGERASDGGRLRWC